MSLEHARRRNPFQSGLPEGKWAIDRFQLIREEGARKNADLTDPGAFLMLSEVRNALESLNPEGPELAGSEGSGHPKPTMEGALHGFGRFLFHAYHVHPDGGRRRGQTSAENAAGIAVPAQAQGTALDPSLPLLIELSEHQGAELLSAQPRPPAQPPKLPAPAGYLLLPRNRVWTHPHGKDLSPEPLDGLAWVQAPVPALGAAEQGVAVMGISGFLPERPGFSVLPFPVIPLTDAQSLETSPNRPPDQGEDFECNLTGGKLAGLHSIETPGEALKLLFRAFLAVSIQADRGSLLPETSSELQEVQAESSSTVWNGWRALQL
jgi:hypothetical protein